MKGFRYFMPTQTYVGTNCIATHKDIFLTLGKKAMIVTGRTSAKKNGSFADVTSVLDELHIAWVLFDEISENPDVETVVRASKQAIAEQVDFFVGIGGGSPMDATKAISVLTANPDSDTNILFENQNAAALPIVEVPTTAGTGSEVTQYSILTLHEKRTKSSIAAHVFATVAFLDAKYMAELSPTITNNTAVDALTHLIESYLCVKSNALSENIVEMGLYYWKDCIPALKSRVYDAQVRENLMMASMLGGIAIAQTGTSIPHALGYYLTYEKQIPHGRANGMVTQAYLELFGENHIKVQKLLSYLGLQTTKEFGALMKEILDCPETFIENDIQYYTKRAMEVPSKLETFPEFTLTQSHILEIYRKSIL